MAPKPGTPGLTSHPALAFGKAAADLPADGDVPVSELVDGIDGGMRGAIHSASVDYDAMMRDPGAAASLDDTADGNAGDPRDEFMADVVRIFEQQAGTADAPPPDDADAPEDAPEDEPDVPDRKPSDDAVHTPATPAAPATDTLAVDPGARLVEWFSSLTPTQIAAIERAVSDPATVLGPAPSSPAAAPAPEPIVPEFDYTELMDDRAAALFRAQQEQINHLRTTLAANLERQMQSTQRTVIERVNAARDAWAEENGVSADDLARLERLPQTNALLRQYAAETDDYEQVTRAVLDQVAWLDPAIREARILAIATQRTESEVNELARVRERKTRAAQVTATPGSAPRVEPRDPSKMSKDERANAAVEFLSERMSGQSA